MCNTLLSVVKANKGKQGASYHPKPLTLAGGIRNISTNKNTLQYRIPYPNKYKYLFVLYYGS